jgi:predicted acyltransferase
MSQVVSDDSAVQAGAQPAASASKQRLLSLDVFRGLTLALMVLVNNHGDGRYKYPPFEHARWHGWTPTDLVFPFFIFIVGVAIPFAFANRVARGESRRKLFVQILRRTVLLFALGLALNGFPYYDFSTIRIMGILQRIALCYLACSLIYLNAKPRTQAWIAGSLLVFYFVVLKFVPVPGFGAGILERDGNWVQFFDIRLMPGHLQSKMFEGKGLLSTLPAIANCLFGLLAGEYLRTARAPLEKVAQMYTAGALAMFAGAVWSLWFPINQNLWTSSLVVFISGMALSILAACYYVIDIRKSTWWTKPFIIFGLNSIAIWVGTSLLRQTLELIKLPQAGGPAISLLAAISQWLASWAGPYNGSLLFALMYVLFWFGIMAELYRRRIFLKI